MVRDYARWSPSDQQQSFGVSDIPHTGAIKDKTIDQLTLSLAWRCAGVELGRTENLLVLSMVYNNFL